MHARIISSELVNSVILCIHFETGWSSLDINVSFSFYNSWEMGHRKRQLGVCRCFDYISNLKFFSRSLFVVVLGNGESKHQENHNLSEYLSNIADEAWKAETSRYSHFENTMLHFLNFTFQFTFSLSRWLSRSDQMYFFYVTMDFELNR